MSVVQVLLCTTTLPGNLCLKGRGLILARHMARARRHPHINIYLWAARDYHKMGVHGGRKDHAGTGTL